MEERSLTWHQMQLARDRSHAAQAACVGLLSVGGFASRKTYVTHRALWCYDMMQVRVMSCCIMQKPLPRYNGAGLNIGVRDDLHGTRCSWQEGVPMLHVQPVLGCCCGGIWFPE